MGDKITTSLLVPCYNAVKYLPRLRTQVDQLMPRFDEVILADDASTDATAEVAKSLGFRVLELSRNKGPGGARNELAREARGEWIHFHDVDDEIVSDYLTRVQPAATEEYGIVLHFIDFLDEQTRELMIRWEFDPEAIKNDPETTLLHGPLPTMSSFIRRSVFDEVGGFNEQLRCFEDGDLHFRIAAHRVKFNSVPEVLAVSLRHNEGVSSNQLYCFRCRLKFLEDYATKVPSRLHHAVAREAGKTATMLLRFGDISSAQRAVKLADQLGLNLPETSNPALRILRRLLPTTTLLRWQDRHRQQSRLNQ